MTGQLNGAATGLNVSVAAGYIGTLDADSIPPGGVAAPFFLVVTVDDELSAGASAEDVQDIVGAMLTDSSEFDFSYNDTAGTGTAALKTTGVVADTYGAAGFIPVITVDSKGRITDVAEVAVSGGGGGGISALTGDVTAAGDGVTTAVAVRNRLHKALPLTPNVGDNFNDNSFDLTKWIRSDASLVQEVNGRIEITGASGQFFADVARRNFTDRFIQVRMNKDGGSGSIMRLFLDAGNNYWVEIFVNGGGGDVRYRTHNPSDGDVTVASVSPITGQDWFKLQHSSSDGLVRAYSATDVSGAPGAWTLRASMTPPVAVTSARVYFLGVSSFDTFDNVTSDIPGNDTVATGETYAWNAGNSQFENTPLGSLQIVTADPTAAPLNLLPGHGLARINSANKKLWIWDGAAWDFVQLA